VVEIFHTDDTVLTKSNKGHNRIWWKKCTW